MQFALIWCSSSPTISLSPLSYLFPLSLTSPLSPHPLAYLPSLLPPYPLTYLPSTPRSPIPLYMEVNLCETEIVSWDCYKKNYNCAGKYIYFFLFRFTRRLQQEAKEMEMQSNIEAARKEKMLKEKHLYQEKMLAEELERLKWEEQRDTRQRQQIRENW